MKFIYKVLIVLFTLTAYQTYAQDDMFKKDRKRVWRKWRSNRQSYNPYLDKKAKNKPSAKIARSSKKDDRKINRAVRKQKKKLKKKNPHH
ncbi:hypothetical protein [Aurantibacillus circumpalustris]|uniref:hypothetical protein n=1 Tax=Aurantibacillus circumpalustris TaxID=3036359 RepID=UPI00295B0E14|nr:hypothetical protein [Aurantibacillus circumpalustris]